VPRLPPARMHWQSFIDKALAKRPEDRYQSANEMLDALDSVQKRIALIAPIAAVATTLKAVPERLERSLNVPLRAKPNSAIAIVVAGVLILAAAWMMELRTRGAPSDALRSGANAKASDAAAKEPSVAAVGKAPHTAVSDPPDAATNADLVA